MTSNAEPSPIENPLLNKLKEKWEAGDFATDKDSVYGIDETVRDAGKRLTDESIITETGTYGVWEMEDGLRKFKPKDPDSTTNIQIGPLIRPSKDPLPHHKTCRFCASTSRDDYCIACYRMIREAAEWVQHPKKMITENGLHPCVICGDNMILNTICPECMELLLGL